MAFIMCCCRCYACDEFVSSSVAKKLHECIELIRASLAADSIASHAPCELCLSVWNSSVAVRQEMRDFEGFVTYHELWTPLNHL